MMSAAESHHISYHNFWIYIKYGSSGINLQVMQARTGCRYLHTTYHICVHTFNLTVTTWIF